MTADQALRGLVDALAVFDDPRHKYHQVVSAVAAAARRVVAEVPKAIEERDRLLREADEYLCAVRIDEWVPEEQPKVVALCAKIRAAIGETR